MNATQLKTRRLKLIPMALLIAIVGLFGWPDAIRPAKAQPQGLRQYYGPGPVLNPDPNGWSLGPGKSYYFQRYYFKSRKSDSRYKYHYVIYFPKDIWIYYFNPKSQTYWCRAAINIGQVNK